jgi:hypothetical protein
MKKKVMKTRFIVSYLNGIGGMKIYYSKEELFNYFKDTFEIETFEELLDSLEGICEVIEVEGNFNLGFIVKD